jgi:hypothetical protein
MSELLDHYHQGLILNELKESEEFKQYTVIYDTMKPTLKKVGEYWFCKWTGADGKNNITGQGKCPRRAIENFGREFNGWQPYPL